jgi:hypothetical protein
MTLNHSHPHGFTLIELATVIATIGLIVGGIMVGQDLVKGAKLNSVMSEVHMYRTAISNFQAKYKQLPGDMVNASGIWSNCDATPSNCNGNGNWLLDDSNNYNERFRFWQHLSLSEVISGNYTGVRSPSSEWIDSGVNTPESAFDNAIVFTHQRMPYKADINSLYFGTIDDDDTEDSSASEAVFTPAEAKKIDRKSDDGHPRAGKIRAEAGVNFSSCETATDYVLSNENIACLMSFAIE